MTLGRIALACCAAVALALVVRAEATPPLPDERIAPGVTAAGLDVSGLTVDEAATRLEQQFGERLRNGAVAVHAAGLTWRLKPATARVRFDALRSAKRALYAGRDLQAATPAPGAAAAGVDVPLAVTYSNARVRNFAARIDRRLQRAPKDAELRITIRRVRVTHSRPGRDINRRELAKTIGAALGDPRISRLLKPKLLRPQAGRTAVEVRKSANTVITIEQATFTLRLFKNLRVVKTYKVAVGQPAYPTPRGLFSITSKQVNPVWSVPNSPWAGELAGTTVVGGSAANPLKARWMGITNGVGIHGTGEGWSIGTRASHGCIRMHVPEVIALYERVPIGTPVRIA